MGSTKCVGALLVRNEAGPDRYLQRALDNAAQFCDDIVVLDDGSTDSTAAVCRAHLKVRTVETRGTGWWQPGAAQSEAPARARLWELACQQAGPTGWIYVFDADHELLGLSPREFKALLRATTVDCWACPLWDCWDREDTHRIDGPWQAWRLPRPWLYRALPGTFGDRPIHVGHAPFRNWVPGLMPAGAGIRHLSYVKHAHRLRKLQQYLSLQPEVPACTASSPPPRKHTPVPLATLT